MSTVSTVSTVSTGSTGSTVSTMLTVSTVIARCYLHLRWYFLCYHTWLSSIENECFPIFSITNGYTKTRESQVMNLENIHLLPLPFTTREGTNRTKINILMFPKWITNLHQYIPIQARFPPYAFRERLKRMDILNFAKGTTDPRVAFISQVAHKS